MSSAETHVSLHILSYIAEQFTLINLDQ